MMKMSVMLSVALIALIGIQSTLTGALLNTVSVAGSDVSLKCQPSSGNCKGVTWTRFMLSTTVSIFRDGSGILNVDRNRYSVNNSSGCDLHIKEIQLTDAGRFICDYIGPDKNSISETAFLIILESSPICTAKVNVTEGPAAEGDGVHLTCEMKFNGTDRASMTWKDLQNVPVSVQNGQDVKLSLSVVAKHPRIPQYDCITTFELPGNIKGLATNIPTISPCKTDSIGLLYSVRDVTLTASTLSVYSPGSPVTCSSDGNPPPTYKWQIKVIDGKDEDWKDIAGETHDEFVTGNATSNHYRCVANNTFRGSSFVAYSPTFQVNNSANNGETPSSVVAIAVGSLIGVVVLLIIITIICLYLRVWKKERIGKSGKGKFSTDDHMPLKETPYANVDGSSNPQNVPVASVRPQPRGDTVKRPTVPPPEPKPRKDASPPQQKEEVLYASLETEKEPVRRFQPKLNEVPNSEYADITLA